MENMPAVATAEQPAARPDTVVRHPECQRPGLLQQNQLHAGICVLISSATQSTSDIAPYDALQRTPAIYFEDDPRYAFACHELHKATAVLAVRDLVRSGQYDVFFNLCDGAWDEDRAGKEVVEALEAFGVPYTGADACFYDPSKAMMKMMAHYEGVATPNYVLAEHPEDIEVCVILFPYVV